MVSRTMALMLWLVGVFTRFVCHPLVEWWLNTVVSTWEETLKLFFHELVFYSIRALNGFSAGFISVFVDRDYYKWVGPPACSLRNRACTAVNSGGC